MLFPDSDDDEDQSQSRILKDLYLSEN